METLQGTLHLCISDTDGTNIPGFTGVSWRSCFVFQRFRFGISGMRLDVLTLKFLFVISSVNMATNALFDILPAIQISSSFDATCCSLCSWIAFGKPRTNLLVCHKIWQSCKLKYHWILLSYRKYLRYQRFWRTYCRIRTKPDGGTRTRRDAIFTVTTLRTSLEH